MGNRYRCEAGLAVFGAVLALAAPGCVSVPSDLRAPQRYRRGLVLVLPGIEGRSRLNSGIAVGLDEGGVTSAIEIYDWTVGLPGGFMYNLVNLERNRREAQRLAGRVVEYRQQHPGRPVHIIGHSGGGGVAVLALEALPAEQAVETAILLAPALSPAYNLTAALERTVQGICNFHSERDVGLLKVGTTVFGSIDRAHGAAAGAVGFILPEELSAHGRTLYTRRLRQVAWSPRLKQYGANGTHAGWAARRFARKYLAPIIQHNEARWTSLRSGEY